MSANDTYETFIKEAFIKPIRSVLIVDDDYPTYSEMLELQKSRNTPEEVEKPSRKLWRSNPEKIKRVIDSFRRPDLALVVDIHDGGDGTEGDIASHLHQSDLLVLDFQLGASPDGGSKSVDIARHVMANEHFNLVVVHTSEDLHVAFRQILLGLTAPCCNNDTSNEREAAQALIEKHEDEHGVIVDKIHGAFSDEQYLFARQNFAVALSAFFQGAAPYAALSAICKNAGWKGTPLRQVFYWAMHRFEDENKKKMHFAGGNKLRLEWSEDAKWIRSHSGFIAFAKKTDADLDILQELCRSLVAWGPEPSRLFLTKLRAEIEESGVVAEDAALGNKFVLARWYAELLANDPIQRRTAIDTSIARHTEQMLDYIQPKVRAFAERLVEHDAKNSESQLSLVKSHFGIDLSVPANEKTAFRDHNIFACSKKPSGWHLDTGHVFVADGQHWVCLTPSCDLVPGQKTTGHYEDVSTSLPFFAVKLQPVSDRQAIDVYSNRFIFLDLKEGKKTFCVSEPSKLTSAPQWYPFYAVNLGRFEQDFRFKFLKLGVEGGQLITITQDAQVVTQLRYEYALHLVQTLGATFTRIGLDFVGTRPGETADTVAEKMATSAQTA
jgi:hypothetical protein